MIWVRIPVIALVFNRVAPREFQPMRYPGWGEALLTRAASFEVLSRVQATLFGVEREVAERTGCEPVD